MSLEERTYRKKVCDKDFINSPSTMFISGHVVFLFLSINGAEYGK